MVLGKLDIHMQKNETRPLSFTIHKDKLKIDERSNCETRFHQNPRGKKKREKKILEENTGNSLFKLGHSNFLQDTSRKARETNLNTSMLLNNTIK